MNIVGIDLGTTNSLISYFKNGKSELIQNSHGEYLTPSVVSILDNGDVIVGRTAKERLYTHPHLTASAFKRFMGTKKQYTLGGHRFTPVELSSLVLKSLKADAEAALGGPIEEAVISVPAYFNDQQRRATKQAGELAGLRVERLISEPTAAALAYGLHEDNVSIQFLVFDLGGGTFDVSVVEMFDNILEVKAVAGDNFLGGEDFDQVISEYFMVNQDLSDLSDKARAIIKEKAEVAKQELSSAKSTIMRVVLDDKVYTTTLTEATFKRISEPIFMRIRKPILRALSDARLHPSELTHVILVGGCSNMPLIRAYASKLFERLPMGYIDPDEAVGLGAGVAAALKERNKDLVEHMMTDVCPYTLGTDVLRQNKRGEWDGNVYLPIIERNTVIPYSKVVRLYNVNDNQKAIRVDVFQGENRKANQNLLLGTLEIEIPPRPSGQAAVDVRYTYDINGLLEVEVTSIETGHTKREVIINSENQLTPQQIVDSLKRLSSLKIHPRDQQENQLLLARAGRLYEESLGDIRQIIDQLTRDFESVLDEQNPQSIKEAAKELAEFLDKIERSDLRL